MFESCYLIKTSNRHNLFHYEIDENSPVLCETIPINETIPIKGLS